MAVPAGAARAAPQAPRFHDWAMAGFDPGGELVPGAGATAFLRPLCADVSHEPAHTASQGTHLDDLNPAQITLDRDGHSERVDVASRLGPTST